MKNIDINLINKIQEYIKNSKNITIFTHVNPDGDAIGSSLALYHYLCKKNKKVSVIIPNHFPHFLKWMDGTDKIIIFKENTELATSQIKDSDLIFCVDFNSPDRVKDTKDLYLESSAIKILIDHHPYPSSLFDILLSDTTVSSTGELIFSLIEESGDKSLINITIAECIFTAILTDTGCFSYNSSNPKTWRIVGDLLEKGINKDYIHSNIYDNFTTERMRLIGNCLHKMIVLPEYKTAYMSISKEEKKIYQYQTGDSEDLVNFPLSIKGIVFTALFIENDDLVKMSFRSRGQFAANQFASEHFNGGGHLNAAGAESKLSLEQTIEKFINLLPNYASKIF